MGTTLTGQFGTRRDAEMAVERLVQEYDIDRSAILVAASGPQNTAGEEAAGSDTEAGSPSTEDRSDAALNGSISVAVDLEDETEIDRVRTAFAEFGASSVEPA